MAVFFGVGVYGGRVSRMHRVMRERASVIVVPYVGRNSEREAGQVIAIHRDMSPLGGRAELSWEIKTPATGEHWWSQYAYGYQAFKTGDRVTFIHPREDVRHPEGYESYVIDERNDTAEVMTLHGTASRSAIYLVDSSSALPGYTPRHENRPLYETAALRDRALARHAGGRGLE